MTPLAPLVLAAALGPAVIQQGDGAEREIKGWGWAVNPDGDGRFKAAGDTLTITAPGPAHDLSAELGKMNAPRVLTSLSGPFTAEVTVAGTFAPGGRTLAARTAYNGAGLLLTADDKTYIRLERAALASGGRTRHYANFEMRVNGKVSRLGRVADMTLDPATPTGLRLVRDPSAGTVTGYVRRGDGAWEKLGTKTVRLPPEVWVGVAAVNASGAPFSPAFSDFKAARDD